jgi:hypothetical protein
LQWCLIAWKPCNIVIFYIYARLPGKAAEQGCGARLPGKAAGSVSNSVLNFQYRGQYNTGISKMSIPVLAGIEVFSRNIPYCLHTV